MNRPVIAPDPTTGSLSQPVVARRWSDLLPRAVSGLVMIVLALGTAILGGLVFVAFWLIAAVAVQWEWQRLIGRASSGLRFCLGAATVLVAVLLTARQDLGVALLALAAGSVATAAVGSVGQRGMAAAGVVYAAAPAMAVVVLRASSPAGFEAILWLFAVVWGTDIFAYFGGRLIGGPKLSPRLSPSKTWAGFVTGIVAGSLLGLLVAPSAANHVAIVLSGLATGALAQGGDLFESALKRRHNVKDASHLIPGHGGVMDRLDGFLVAAVFAACLGAARAGVAAAGYGLFNW